MNDDPIVDATDKNARRIFYDSLTNLGTTKKIGYSYRYSIYIYRYIESLFSRFFLFIIGTKLSHPSLLQKLLCEKSKKISEYNFGFRELIQPIQCAGPSGLRPAGRRSPALL
jgi:hypothetical protein